MTAARVVGLYNEAVVPFTPFRRIGKIHGSLRTKIDKALTAIDIDDFEQVFKTIVDRRGLVIHGRMTIGKLFRANRYGSAPYYWRILEGEYDTWNDPKLKPGEQPTLRMIIAGDQPADWLQPPEGFGGPANTRTAFVYCEAMRRRAEHDVRWLKRRFTGVADLAMSLGDDPSAVIRESHIFQRMKGLIDPIAHEMGQEVEKDREREVRPCVRAGSRTEGS